MGTILSPSLLNIGVKDRDQLAQTGISCDWLRLPLEEAQPTFGAGWATVEGNVEPGIKPIVGTDTNIWDNIGYITPLEATGATIAMQSAAVKEFMRLDTLGNGGFLIALDFFFAINNVGTETVLSSSPADATNGGWRLDMDGAGNMLFKVKQFGSGSFTNALTFSSVNSANSWNNGRVAVVIYIDNVAKTISATMRKSGRTDKPLTTDISAYSLPGVGTSGLGINCKIEDAGAGASEYWAKAAGSGKRTSNVIMIKPTTDVSADIATFLEQFWVYRHQLPYVTRNWT